MRVFGGFVRLFGLLQVYNHIISTYSGFGYKNKIATHLLVELPNCVSKVLFEKSRRRGRFRKDCVARKEQTYFLMSNFHRCYNLQTPRLQIMLTPSIRQTAPLNHKSFVDQELC